MKLKIRKDIYDRAKVCADKVDMPVGEWCGLACVKYAPADYLSVVAGERVCGVATVATIDGSWFAGHARRCIAAAVDAVEAINARNQSWVGGSPSAALAKTDEMKRAIEASRAATVKRLQQREEVAV